MKLVQKVLSHGLLIAFIVAAFFIYTNRMDLFPQWFAKPAPATAGHSQRLAESQATATQAARSDTVVSEPETGVSEPVAELSAVTAVDNQSQVSAEAVQSTDEQQIPASDDAEPVFRPLEETEPVAVADAVSGNEVGTLQTEDVSTPLQKDGEAATAGQLATEQAAAGPDAVQAVQPAGMQDSSAAVAAEPEFRPLTETEPVEVVDAVSGDKADSPQAEVVSAPQQQAITTGQAAAGQDTAAQADFQARLETARAYFWQRDIRAALQAYQSLAESYPERAEVWGELGNLYFNIRRTPAAVNAYANALELLIEQGDTASARALLNVMYRLDARRASQFEMRLRQTGGGVTMDGR